jgi:diguanylate cyclase (GGDEF)-like protein
MKYGLDSVAPLIDRGRADVAALARVSGLLYMSGALLVMLSLVLPHPIGAFEGGLMAIAVIAALWGALIFRYATLVEPWMIHALLMCATALVSLCVYFSGLAAGIYSLMFIWVIVVAACAASRVGLLLQTAWILATYGAALIALEGASAGFSAITRFAVTGFALSVAGAAVSSLVEGRRAAEEGLHREIESRKQLQRELEHLANHDPLTGVANRRQLEQHLERVLESARRTGAPLCLVALDLDSFKAFNDSHGHAAGDRLLKASTSAWLAVLRNVDVITRLGGDEFLVVLPDCPLDVANRIADRLVAAMPNGESCSIGVVCWQRDETADELLHAADSALYEAKAARRGTLV